MKYVLREIGWVWNDSTYYRDGEYGAVEVFDTFEEANETLKELNYHYFCNNLSILHRYETYGDTLASMLSYKEKLSDYLVETFDLNPTIKLRFHSGYRPEMFLKRPTIEEVNELLKVMKIDFFSISKIENKNNNLYRAAVNKLYSGDERRFLWDSEGMHELNFASKREAVERFIGDRWIFGIFTNAEWGKVKGSLPSLSSMPELLKVLIENSEHLKYEDSVLTLFVSIDSDTFLQLNSLLKNPILQFKEVEIEINEEVFFGELTSKINRNKHSWKDIGPKSLHPHAVESYKKGIDYLNNFVLNMELYSYSSSSISKRIKRYLEGNLSDKLEDKWGTYYYKNKRIQLLGVVLSEEKIEGKYFLESCFGFHPNPQLNLESPSKGGDADFDVAFEMCLENWLKEFGYEYIASLESENR